MPLIVLPNIAATMAQVCVNMFFFIRDDLDDIEGVLGILCCLHLFSASRIGGPDHWFFPLVIAGAIAAASGVLALSPPSWR